MAGSFPTLQPSPSVLQKALQQPTEHARHLGEKSHARACDTSRLSLWLCVRKELPLADCASQVWETERILKNLRKKNTKWTRSKWQMKEARHSLLPVTVSLNLHPVLACQAPSQMVTLNMAVNSQWAASLPSSWKTVQMFFFYNSSPPPPNQNSWAHSL